MTHLADIFSYFFSPSRPLSLGVNTLIAAMAAYSLLQLWRRGFRAIQRESVGLRAVQSRLNDVRGSQGTSSATEPLKHAADNAKLRVELAACKSANLTSSPLVRSRITNLEALQEQGDEINHDSLAAIVLSRLDGQASLARWATSAVVLLGLTGTLLGLTQAVQGAAALLSGASGASVGDAIAAVSGTFDGVQVAFSTTLAGALSAIGIGMAVALLRRKQGQFVSDFEELTAVQLIPIYRTSAGLSLAQTAHKVAALEEQLRDTLRLLLQDLQRRGDHLVNTVERHLSVLTDEFAGRSERLLALFAQTQTAVGKLLGEPGADVPSLSTTLTAIQQGVRELQSAVDTASALIPALEESISRQVDRQTADINEAVNAYTGSIEQQAQKQSTAIERGMARFDELIPQLAETIARGVDQQTSDINAAIHAQTQEMKGGLEQQQMGLQQLTSVLSAFDDSVERLLVALESTQAGLGVNNEQVLAGVNELRDLRADLRESLTNLVTLVSGSPGTRPSAASRSPYEEGSGGVAVSIESNGWGVSPHRYTHEGAKPEPDDVSLSGNAPTSNGPRKNLWQRWFGNLRK